MSLSWNELEVGECYEQGGKYLGKFIRSSTIPTSASHVDDVVIYFEKKDLYYVDGMKFKKVDCSDTRPAKETKETFTPIKETFTPIVETDDSKKSYRCPLCNKSSTLAPGFPAFMPHTLVDGNTCPNKGKIPIESTIGGKRTKYMSKRKSKRNTKRKKRKRRN